MLFFSLFVLNMAQIIVNFVEKRCFYNLQKMQKLAESLEKLAIPLVLKIPISAIDLIWLFRYF